MPQDLNFSLIPFVTYLRGLPRNIIPNSVSFLKLPLNFMVLTTNLTTASYPLRNLILLTIHLEVLFHNCSAGIHITL